MSKAAAARFAPWATWLVGMLAAFYPALLSGFRQVQVNHGDPRLVNYLLEHTFLWLTGRPGHESFWSPPVFHPALHVGAYSDTVVGAAPFYWLWRFAGFEGGVALQLWVMTCFALNFWLAFLFLSRCLRSGSVAASFGAFFFGFGITRLANFNSPQLFPVFYAMLAFHAAHRALEPREPDAGDGGRVAWVFLFFAALAAQAWSAFYPTFFLLLILAVAASVALLFREGRTRVFGLLRRHPAAVALAVLLSLAAVVPLATAHLRAAEDLGWRDYWIVHGSLPVWQSWIFTGNHNLVYEWLARLDAFRFPIPSQHSNGVGLLTTCVCLVGLFQNRRRTFVKIVFLTTSILLLLTTRWPGGDSLWQLAFPWIPGAGAVRYVARIGIFLVVPVAIGAALFIDGRRALWPRWAVALVMALCVLEQLHDLPSFEEAPYREAVERVAARVDPDCDAFLLTTRETAEPRKSYKLPRRTHVLAMWVGIRSGLPTVNGFYGNDPPGWSMSRVDIAFGEDGSEIRAALEGWLERKGVASESVCGIEVPAAWMPWNRPGARRGPAL
jgi:hypothetical protein